MDTSPDNPLLVHACAGGNHCNFELQQVFGGLSSVWKEPAFLITLSVKLKVLTVLVFLVSVAELRCVCYTKL